MSPVLIVRKGGQKMIIVNNIKVTKTTHEDVVRAMIFELLDISELDAEKLLLSYDKYKKENRHLESLDLVVPVDKGN